MEDSIFTMIIKGDIPSYKIYEDDKTIAFLDIHPKTTGHTLVVPKAQIEFIWDLEDEDYQAVMKTAKKVAKRLKEVYGTRYVGEQVIGEMVPHAHVHVFPFDTLEEYKTVPDMKSEVNHDSLRKQAKKLAF